MIQPVSVSRVIAAPAKPIFDLLADPAGHTQIDGSGTLTGARSGGRRLALGDSFGMSMNWGVSYATRNVVVEFEENRRIAWQTLAPQALLQKLFTGRIWRYELEEVEGGTRVTETWDPTTEAAPARLFMGRLSDLTRHNMKATLARLDEVVTGSEGTS